MFIRLYLSLSIIIFLRKHYCFLTFYWVRDQSCCTNECNDFSLKSSGLCWNMSDFRNWASVCTSLCVISLKCTICYCTFCKSKNIFGLLKYYKPIGLYKFSKQIILNLIRVKHWSWHSEQMFSEICISEYSITCCY